MYIHIEVLPVRFLFLMNLSLIYEETCRAKHEYINIPFPFLINIPVTVLSHRCRSLVGAG